MKLMDMCKKLGLKVVAGNDGLENDVTGVYICDLLSWVMSHAKKGDAWITVMTHSNVIAVASLLELGCIIIPEDIEIDEDTLTKAEEENIPVLATSKSAYKLATDIYDLGIGK